MSVRFTNSCAPIGYPCRVGDKYINPCTCRHYYECQVGGYNFLQRQCGGGTAWNHRTGFCIQENEIFIANGTPICVQDEPWLRCSKIPNSYGIQQLEDYCETGISPTNDPANSTPLPTDAPTQAGRSGSSGDGNTAAVVGGVVGGVLALVLVAFFIFWWKKRQPGKSKKSNITFKPSIHRIDNIEHEEEVYDVIEEKHTEGSSIPTVNNVVYGQRPPTEYDNPAFSGKSESETNNNYNSLSHRFDEQSGKTNLEVSTRTSTDNSNSNKSYNSSLTTREHDLSRSISVGGQDVLVEDFQGYQIGYPSGTVPRQPSPLLLPPADDDRNDDEPYNFGYDLGSALPPPGDFNSYTNAEKTDL